MFSGRSEMTLQAAATVACQDKAADYILWLPLHWTGTEISHVARLAVKLKNYQKSNSVRTMENAQDKIVGYFATAVFLHLAAWNILKKIKKRRVFQGNYIE